MAYIFFYKPVQLLIDGKKAESLNLFLKTIGSFAIITLIFFFSFIPAPVINK